MSDVFSLFEEGTVDADKFDTVEKEGASRLSNLIRQSLDLDKQIADADQFVKDLKFKKKKSERRRYSYAHGRDGRGV